MTSQIEVDTRLCKLLLQEFDLQYQPSQESIQTLTSLLSNETKVPFSIMVVALTYCPSDVIKLILPYASDPLQKYVQLCILHNSCHGLKCLIEAGATLHLHHLEQALQSFQEYVDIIQLMIHYFHTTQQSTICSAVWSTLATCDTVSTLNPLVDTLIQYRVPLPPNVMYEATLHLNSNLIQQMWQMIEPCNLQHQLDIFAMLRHLLQDDNDEYKMVIKHYIIKSIPHSKFIPLDIMDEAKLILHREDTSNCAKWLVEQHTKLSYKEYSDHPISWKVHSWFDYILVQPITSLLSEWFRTY